MKIAFTGDLVLQNTEELQPEIVFSEFNKVLEKYKCDRLIVNLESPITEGLEPIKDKICLKAKKEEIKHLKYLSPTLVNLSNNHINDFGNQGVIETLASIKESGLRCFGVGYGNENKHIVIDEEYIAVAYTHNTADLTSNILHADDKLLGPKNVNLDELALLRERYKDKVLIVSIHWGIEDISIPCPEVVDLAHKVINSGADVIIGHHPHIIQPIEIYKNKYIFYSLGNFFFPAVKIKTQRSEFIKAPSAHQKLGLVPILDLSNGISVEIFRVSVVNGVIDVRKKKAEDFKFVKWHVTLFPIINKIDSKFKLYKYYLQRLKKLLVK